MRLHEPPMMVEKQGISMLMGRGDVDYQADPEEETSEAIVGHGQADDGGRL